MFGSVYDDITSDTVNQLQICSIAWSPKKSVMIEIMDVLKLRGCVDCGLFALAFSTPCVLENNRQKKDLVKRFEGTFI